MSIAAVFILSVPVAFASNLRVPVVSVSIVWEDKGEENDDEEEEKRG